jgi:hypothetical protein
LVEFYIIYATIRLCLLFDVGSFQPLHDGGEVLQHPIVQIAGYPAALGLPHRS